MIRRLAGLLAVFATLALTGCGYNDLQRQDEGIKASWSEVLNQYQRRADLVPNLVNTVKGYAAQEEEVLVEVTNARAQRRRASRRRRNSSTIPWRSRNSSRRRASCRARCPGCWSCAENYPQLKSDALFRDLTAQLEGTENRITVARNRYIKTVQEYNTTVRQLPDQPDGDGVQDGREAELHGRERGRDQRGAEGRLQQGAGRRPQRRAGAAPSGRSAAPPELRKKGDCRRRSDRNRPMRPDDAAFRSECDAAAAVTCCAAGGSRAGRAAAAGGAAHAWEAGTDGLMPVPPLAARVTDLDADAHAGGAAGARRQARGLGVPHRRTSSWC